MFELIYKQNTSGAQEILTSLRGYDVLNSPKLNKGCAFSLQERKALGLIGLLPHHVETLEEQISRMAQQYPEQASPLSRNIYLNALHNYNETLFYAFVSQHLEKLLPILYTPTISEAVKRFSAEHRRPHGLYLSYQERNCIDQALLNKQSKEVDLIVVTDGEAVLGIGDQGIGGINISIAKLMVYTLCGGIHPNRVIPIQLDVGTDNEQLLNDPMYLGARHKRLRGKEYFDFVDQFMQGVKKHFPNAMVHWEDLARDNATTLLEKYKNEVCNFNDDMQGTGAVALAAILSGIQASEIPLEDHRIVIFGAGTAGLGITEQIYAALIRAGIPENQAKKQFWLIDKKGLVTDQFDYYSPEQKKYARDHREVEHFHGATQEGISLEEVIRQVKPSILIGCSTVSNAFSENIIKTMAAHVKRPIIMPLSNPTHLAEATPENLIHWTSGRALIATGSPFEDVVYQNKNIPISQSNNALIFPGIGLGIIAVGATRLTDDMLWIAAKTLADLSPAKLHSDSALLPKLAHARQISFEIAIQVAKVACDAGLNRKPILQPIENLVRQTMWEPVYLPTLPYQTEKG